MKKAIGIILIVIVGLNFISIVIRASKGEPVGSPIYFVILILMFIGGLVLINQSKQTSTNQRVGDNNIKTPQVTNIEKTEFRNNVFKIGQLNFDPGNKFIEEKETILTQKKILEEMRLSNLFTSDEYTEKIKLLDEQEENLDKELKQVCIDKLVTDISNPMILNLESLVKSGLLTEEDLKLKKEKISVDNYQKIISLPYLDKQSPPIIEMISLLQLDPWNREEARKFGLKLRFGEVILFNRRSQNLDKLTTREWIDLYDSSNKKDYFYVDIPDLFK